MNEKTAGQIKPNKIKIFIAPKINFIKSQILEWITIMIETEFCPYCIHNLERDKYLQEFYTEICEHYADTNWPYLLIDNRGLEHLRKLELLGYVVSTECDINLIDVLPIGYYRSDERCYFCRDATHSNFN